MGCCGGAGGGRQRRTVKPADVKGTKPVLMAYVGPRAELFSTRGPATKTKYYASCQEHEQVVPVWLEDAPGLEATGFWVMVDEEAG